MEGSLKEMWVKLEEIAEMPDFWGCGAFGPRMVGHDGSTPLHVAALWGDLPLLLDLLSVGAAINAATTEGYTPLHFSVMWGHVDIVQVLLLKGADPLLETNDGLSAFDLTELIKVSDSRDRINQLLAVYSIDGGLSGQQPGH